MAKENIFSKLNNIKVYTVKDKKFSQYFGLAPEETETLLNYYRLKLNNEVKAKYDGYHMGDYEIYNPWSILNYADDKELNAYWVHTSANTMIKDSISKNTSMDHTNSFKENYEKLITQGYLETIVRLETSFYEQADEASLWGLFVNAGYLTITEIKDDDDYVIRIPNDEVKSEFQSLIAYQLNLFENLFHDSLIKENSEKFIKTYQLMFQ